MGDHCDCILAGQRETNYNGNLKGSIMFVGESPGYEELKEGIPFVGRSGRLLTNTIQKQSIPMEMCFFANSARCMIQKDNLTQKEVNSILKSCRINLETMIYHVSPKLIVPLGAIALQQVMNMKGIKKARGNFYWSEEFNCWILPNWHPAYILRNANEEDNFIRVFRTIRTASAVTAFTAHRTVLWPRKPHVSWAGRWTSCDSLLVIWATEPA